MDPTVFKSLPETKQKAVILRAQGQTWALIAKEVHVSERTVARWFGPDGSLLEALEEYQEFLAQQKIQKEISFQEKVSRDSEVIWERLKSIALSDDSDTPKHVSLAAVDSMLDRIGIARVTKTEGKHSVAVTDEDRRKRFREIAELQADIKPEQLLQLAGGK